MPRTASGETQEEVLEAFFAGERAIEDVRALGPWFERHAEAFERERVGRRPTSRARIRSDAGERARGREGRRRYP